MHTTSTLLNLTARKNVHIADLRFHALKEAKPWPGQKLAPLILDVPIRGAQFAADGIAPIRSDLTGVRENGRPNT